MNLSRPNTRQAGTLATGMMTSDTARAIDRCGVRTFITACIAEVMPATSKITTKDYDHGLLPLSQAVNVLADMCHCEPRSSPPGIETYTYALKIFCF